MLTLPLVRSLLIATATFALPGGADPTVVPAPARNDTLPSRLDMNSLHLSSTRTTLMFRGRPLVAPPGVRLLPNDTLLIGGVVVEVPLDVVVEFTDSGDAIFELAPDAPPHAWVLIVGKKKLVASAGARAIVPWPGVGVPRIEWSRFAYPVPAPRDSLNQARDLQDPFDASPYN
ncbi:MAG: hypothetical protein EXS13_11500 [Planctomycetes bacterium]|nr:hypothetical protein [Planctomycetota bacterium]